MVKNNGLEYLVETKHIDEIVSNMKNNISDCNPIMIDRIVKRALYKVNHLDDGQNRWIRIMEGDIECSGETRCTITYKNKKRDMSGEEYALLKVESFEDATHLFDLLRYERASYQENKRSKFVCILDDIKYTIRFDIWPKIEDLTFIAINVASSARSDDMEGFVSALGIDLMNIDKNDMVDVDNEYKKRIGKVASEIPIITFDLNF
ncbi:MAG: hypothetical protein FWE08_04525 [Oscillospiraceae bacterium]|nr:hypothetical protein [Oscillospiraceae bacterium]